MAKIYLPAANAWLIRRVHRRTGKRSFWESGDTWKLSPAHATIFRTYDAGINFMLQLSKLREYYIYDCVPMFGALLTQSGGKDENIST